MTLLGSRQQRLADLHLYLYSRCFHPELFQIYASQRVHRSAYEADLWIIGCSHLVSFSSGGATLTELTTSDQRWLGTRQLLCRFPVRGERTCRQSVADGRINYIASFQVEVLSAHLYRQMHAELVDQGRESGLLVEFDQWRTHDGLAPFACLSCERLARELRVSAFHGFPDDCSLVKTQSIFEVR